MFIWRSRSLVRTDVTILWRRFIKLYTKLSQSCFICCLNMKLLCGLFLGIVSILVKTCVFYFLLHCEDKYYTKNLCTGNKISLLILDVLKKLTNLFHFRHLQYSYDNLWNCMTWNFNVADMIMFLRYVIIIMIIKV